MADRKESKKKRKRDGERKRGEGSPPTTRETKCLVEALAAWPMNKAVRWQVRLGAITHQSLGQDPLKDTSCLNGKEKEGAVAGEG